MHSDYLEHYGRKGMKWYQSVFGSKERGNAIKNRISEYKKRKDVLKERKRAIKNRSLMNEAELNKLGLRLQREKLIVDLDEQNVGHGRRQLRKWTDASSAAFKTSMSTVLIAATTATGLQLVKTLFSKYGGDTGSKIADTIRINSKKK